MPKSLEDHAENFDLRHEDFKDPDFCTSCIPHARQRQPSRTPISRSCPRDDGAWVAMTLRRVLRDPRDWETFSSKSDTGDAIAVYRVTSSSGSTHHASRRLRKVLNPYFSPGRMKQLQPQIRAETDALINEFIEDGRGDLAVVAWQQPGIVFFKYLLGMPVGDVPLCIELTDTALNGETEEIRLTAWGGLYQHITKAVTTRMQGEPQDDMIDVLLSAEIDGVKLRFDDVVSNAMLLVQAGLETTASAMSCAFHYLGSRPDERDRLIHEPELMSTAVEELDPLRRIDSRHSANGYQGSRNRWAEAVPGPTGHCQLRIRQSRRPRVCRCAPMHPRPRSQPPSRIRRRCSSLPGVESCTTGVPHRRRADAGEDARLHRSDRCRVDLPWEFGDSRVPQDSSGVHTRTANTAGLTRSVRGVSVRE